MFTNKVVEYEQFDSLYDNLATDDCKRLNASAEEFVRDHPILTKIFEWEFNKQLWLDAIEACSHGHSEGVPHNNELCDVCRMLKTNYLTH